MILDELVPGDDFPVEPAKRDQRLVNLLIDIVILVLGFFMLVQFLPYVFAPFSLFFSSPIGLLVFIVLFIFLYYALCEGMFGKTLGKMVTRTKVVNESGLPASGQQVFVRTICRFIPVDPFTFFTKDARGWHDKLSKTKVVKDTYR